MKQKPENQTAGGAKSSVRTGASASGRKDSNKGHLQFMVFKQRFIAAVFVEFLTRLLRQAKGQKIILILDGHPVHRSNRVRRFVEAHPEQIELQSLPGHSPELNPTELLNQDRAATCLCSVFTRASPSGTKRAG